jgi:hyperosmotically inducible periplasmic protein
LRSLLALFILLLLAGAAYYYWRYRPAEVQGARRALGSVGEKLQATKTAAAVKAALELDRNLKQYPIDVDAGAQEGVVVLRGEVPSEAARADVERRVAAVPDVRQVANELRVNPALPQAAADAGRTLGESFDDRALEAKVRMALSLNRDLKGTHIDVRSYRRQVTLAGQVDSPAQHQLAVEIATRTTDVVGVTDQIGVRGQTAPPPASSPAVPPLPAATPTPRPGARYHVETGRIVLTS